jgi:hypothetical protein
VLKLRVKFAIKAINLSKNELAAGCDYTRANRRSCTAPKDSCYGIEITLLQLL